MTSGCANSPGFIPARGAPNSANARKTLSALSGADSTRISRSLVYLGSVYSMTAYPPTTIYLASKRFKALNRSLKFEFRLTSAPPAARLLYHFPCRRKDGVRPLTLPELHVEGAVAFRHFADPLHDFGTVFFAHPDNSNVGTAGALHVSVVEA